MAGENNTGGKRDTTLRSGQIVGGNYRIDRLIGKGGMAAVWEATNQRSGKRVAIKAILSGAASTTTAADMLHREALAASRVNHPNVVNIYDVIDHEGLTCIVMEMLDGETLGAYMARKGYLGFEEAATLLVPAMRGVAAANTLGVVHRDLKPQNIFLCIGTDGRLLTTKVLDFGISVMMEQAMGSPLAAQMLPTHGTPAYMSPEHIQGLADIDARADVYGFGVLFFETLTGQLPFLGEPGQELLVRIVSEPAPKVTLFRPDLPASWWPSSSARWPRGPGIASPICMRSSRRSRTTFCLRHPCRARSLPWPGFLCSHWPSSDQGAPLPAAQAVSPSESSAPREASDTKELFTLPREPQESDRTASRKIVIIQPAAQGTPGEGQAAPPPARDARPRFTKRLASVAMFLGVLLFVAWLAFPNIPSVQDDDEPLPANLARRKPAGDVASPAAVFAPSVGKDLGQPDGGR